MTTSFPAEIRDVAQRLVDADFGGRAMTREVVDTLIATLPGHLIDYVIRKGLTSEVNAMFRAKAANGLPRYPEANPAGEHVQFELLSVDESAYVYESYRKRGAANFAKAQLVREACLDAHHVDLAARKERAS